MRIRSYVKEDFLCLIKNRAAIAATITNIPAAAATTTIPAAVTTTSTTPAAAAAAMTITTTKTIGKGWC